MPEGRVPSPAKLRALHAEWEADQAAARARDYGEADAATYAGRIWEGSTTVGHLDPQPPSSETSGLGSILDRIERSGARRDEPGREKGRGADREPER